MVKNRLVSFKVRPSLSNLCVNCRLGNDSVRFNALELSIFTASLSVCLCLCLSLSVSVSVSLSLPARSRVCVCVCVNAVNKFVNTMIVQQDLSQFC